MVKFVILGFIIQLWIYYLQLEGKINGRRNMVYKGVSKQVGDIFLVRFWSTYLHRGKGHYQWGILGQHHYPVMKHLYPDVSGLFQDDNGPVQKGWEVAEWFDEYENGFSFVSWLTLVTGVCVYKMSQMIKCDKRVKILLFKFKNLRGKT